MSTPENEYIKVRKDKAEELRKEGMNPFINGISPTTTTAVIHEKYDAEDAASLEKDASKHSIAGRVMAIRSFGKAAFLQIRDRAGNLQVFVQKQRVGDEQFKLFKKLDVGDIGLFEGEMFRTKTGELTLNAATLTLVTKAYRPLPEKWHGLTDVETRYRQRYVDLIVNDDVKKTFVARSQIIQAIRSFMVELPGGRDADDASDSRWCGCETIHYSS